MTALRRLPDQDTRRALRNSRGPAALHVRPAARRMASWLVASAASLAATVVLVAVTGLPATSVPDLLPHSGEQAGPPIGL